MSIADGFERGILFRLTRVLALMIVVALLIGALIGLYTGWSMWPKGNAGEVSATEVVAKLTSEKNTGIRDETTTAARQPAQESPLDGVRLPAALLPEFAAPGQTPSEAGAIWADTETRSSNREVLGKWIALLDPPQQQQYLDEMAAAVEAAEKAGFERSAAINSYAAMKQERAEAAIAEEAKAKEMRIWGAGIAGAALLLIALFSLVLVLLAIERNTREPTTA